MNKKPETVDKKPEQAATPPAPPEKKKLSLDVTDVSEVLERKISP